MLICVFPDCPGHDGRIEAILHGQQHLAAGQVAILRILRTLTSETEHNRMELDDKLAAINAALDVLDTDEQRVLADLQSLKDAQGSLTPEQEATLDGLLAKVQAEDAAMVTVDPAPAADVPAA